MEGPIHIQLTGFESDEKVHYPNLILLGIALERLGVDSDQLSGILDLVKLALDEIRYEEKLSTLCPSALCNALDAMIYNVVLAGPKEASKYCKEHEMLDAMVWYMTSIQDDKGLRRLGHKCWPCHCTHENPLIARLHQHLQHTVTTKRTLHHIFYRVSAFMVTFIERNHSHFVKRFVNRASGSSSRWPAHCFRFLGAHPAGVIQSTAVWMKSTGTPIPLRYLYNCLLYAPPLIIPAILSNPSFLSLVIKLFAAFSKKLHSKYAFSRDGCVTTDSVDVCVSDVKPYLEFWEIFLGWRGRYPRICEILKAQGRAKRLLDIVTTVLDAFRNITETMWTLELRWRNRFGAVFVDEVRSGYRELGRTVWGVIDEDGRNQLPPALARDPSQPEATLAFRAVSICAVLLAGTVCMSPGCINTVENEPFRFCSRCGVVRYCCEGCHAIGWEETGIRSHRVVCRTLGALKRFGPIDWEGGFSVVQHTFWTFMSDQQVGVGDVKALLDHIDVLTGRKMPSECVQVLT